MIVTRRYNQYRRDLSIDMKCEGCGALATYDSAYDDYNFWANVVPFFKCPDCDLSSKDLGSEAPDTSTKYPEGMQI